MPKNTNFSDEPLTASPGETWIGTSRSCGGGWLLRLLGWCRKQFQLVPGCRVIRLETQRLGEVGQDLVALALTEQCHAEVEMGFGVIGV